MTLALKLELEFLEPVVLTEGSSQAQGHQSLNYVPGTSLLGALAGRFDPVERPDQFHNLFLSDRVRFLNAYPHLGGQRCLPVPMSLAINKDDDDQEGPLRPVDLVRYARTRIGAEHRRRDHGENVRFESLPRPFINPETCASPHLRKGTRTHVGIDADKRAGEEGVLFTYEFLQAGQKMSSYVLCEKTGDADLLQRAIEQRPRIELGRSRASGYGATRVQVTRIEEFQEYDRGAVDFQTHKQEHVVTLLSDYCPGVCGTVWENLMDELEAVLGDFDRGKDVVRADTRTRTVRGFKGVWGLPRPPIEVLKKGSVIRLQTAQVEALLSLADAGMGRRRNEGFGRIAVDWAIHAARIQLPPAEQRNVPRSSGSCQAAVSGSSGDSASIPMRVLRRRQAKRICRDTCARALSSDRASDLAQKVAGNPSVTNTQLTNLRSAVLAADSIERVEAWFDELLEKTSAAKWKRARVPSLALQRSEYLATVVQEQLLADNGAACESTISGLVEQDDPFASLIGSAHDTEERHKLTHRLCREFIAGLVNRILSLRNAG